MRSFYADIYISLSPGYTNDKNPFTKDYALDLIQKFIDEISESHFAVNVQDTTFVYPNGKEVGIKIGLIQYPRFPTRESLIFQNAYDLANYMMKNLNQFRCTIQTPKDVMILENDSMPEEYKDS